MARERAAIPAALNKTLLEWIEFDDGDTSTATRPTCSAEVQALHARIAIDPTRDGHGPGEPLPPPAALCLPPLG